MRLSSSRFAPRHTDTTFLLSPTRLINSLVATRKHTIPSHRTTHPHSTSLGRSEHMQLSARIALRLARENQLYVVIDADGLFLVQNDPSVVRGYERAVLTPNVVEFGRLVESCVSLVRSVSCEAGSRSRSRRDNCFCHQDYATPNLNLTRSSGNRSAEPRPVSSGYRARLRPLASARRPDDCPKGPRRPDHERPRDARQ